MTEIEAIEKAIRHFKCVKVVLDSGFGTHSGENDLVYRSRKMYAELAISAMEKQIPKKPVKRSFVIPYEGINVCPGCKNPAQNKERHCRCGQKLDWSD